MGKKVSELAHWFQNLPAENQYQFSSKWIQTEAPISQEALAGYLGSTASVALIKRFKSYDFKKQTLKKISGTNTGIRLQDIELVCRAINKYRDETALKDRVSSDLFYDQAWCELSQQFQITPPLAAGNTQDMLDMYAELLSKSKQWTTVQPVLRRSQNIDIRDLYVEIRLLSDEREGLKSFDSKDFISENDFVQQDRGQHYISAESLVARASRRNVLVGPPGAGKSTLMRWLCVYLLDELAQFKMYPVPIQLKSFADELENKPDLSFLAYVWMQLTAESGQEGIVQSHKSADFVRLLRSKKIIYLLDGWDEVPPSMRKGLRETISRETANDCTLITSRQSGIPDLLQDGQTTFYEFGSLTDYAIAKLCRQYGQQRNATQLIPVIFSQLEKTPSLWSVSGNPYLLTLFCEVFFAHETLPEYRVCSPYWVMAEATKLMTKNHNYAYPYPHPDHLTQRDIERMEALACELSFGEQEKCTTFDPVHATLCLEINFIASALAASRFFNANKIKSEEAAAQQFFEFSHLRLQEFFAAEKAVRSGLYEQPKWIEKKLLSTLWREEICFMGAILADQDSDTVFWQTHAGLMNNPDIGGEVLRRIVGILAVAGVEDGGVALLGCDVREHLWHLINPMQVMLDENLSALLALDVAFLEQKLYEEEVTDALLAEIIYRKIPLQLRRNRLDAKLRKNKKYSWLVGLPARAFPTKEVIDKLISDALNPQKTEEKRIAAMRDLGAARAVECVEPLLHLIDDKNENIANATIETLSKIGGRSVAMAMAEQLVKTPIRVEIVHTLLNALTLSGYGIMESYARDFLVEELIHLPDNHDSLSLVLHALEGSPIPWPPSRLLQIVDQKNAFPEAMRVDAANVFRGITDAAFLTRALDLQMSECSVKVRIQLIKACPFIPTNYHAVPVLWEQFLVRSEDVQEKNQALYLLLLCLRSLRLFGNHPIGSLLTTYMEQALDKIQAGDETTLHKLVLKHAELLCKRRNARKIQENLVNIAISTKLSEEFRVLAVAALAYFKTYQSTLDTLYNVLQDTVQLGHAALRLSEELATTLFTCRPALAPSLIKLAQSADEDTCQMLTVSILTKAQRWGYLIYMDHVIGPDGQKVLT